MSLNSGMKRLLLNLLKSTAILGMASLLGWYTHQSFGIIGIVTNVVFFAMGALWIATWDRGKNKSEPTSEIQCLSETDTGVLAAASTESADKPETTSDQMFHE